MRDISKYTQDYLKPNFEEYQLKYRRKKILEILNQYPYSEILEIGCGTDPLFQYINSNSYKKYVIVEPSIEFFNHACKEAAFNNKIEIINEYFTATEQLKKRNFDFILCSSLLHEVEEPEIILRDINKICNINTVIHINVPNALSFHRVLAKAMGLIEDVYDMSERNHLFQQNRVYDLKLLEEIVINTGFSIIEKGSYFIKPFTHKQMYQMMESQIIDEKVLEGLYNLEKYFKDLWSDGVGSEIYVNIKKK